MICCFLSGSGRCLFIGLIPHFISKSPLLCFPIFSISRYHLLLLHLTLPHSPFPTHCLPLTLFPPPYHFIPPTHSLPLYSFPHPLPLTHLNPLPTHLIPLPTHLIPPPTPSHSPTHSLPFTSFPVCPPTPSPGCEVGKGRLVELNLLDVHRPRSDRWGRCVAGALWRGGAAPPSPALINMLP